MLSSIFAMLFLGAVLADEVSALAAKRRGDEEKAVAIVTSRLGQVEDAGRMLPDHLWLIYSVDERAALQELGRNAGWVHGKYVEETGKAKFTKLLGTRAERDALQQQIDAAKRARAKRLPELENERRRLQEEIGELEAAVSKPAGELAERNAALVRLRAYAPPEIREKYHREIRRIQGLKREAQQLHNKAKEASGWDGSMPDYSEFDAMMEQAGQLLDDPAVLAR